MTREQLKYFKSLPEKGNALKDVIQNYAVDLWVKNNCIGFFCFFTGFGKTNSALLSCRRFFSKYEGSVNVTVPTSKLKSQWESKIEKWELSNVAVCVINSYTMNFANETINRKPDIFIADELHRICNEDSKYFSKALEITEYDMFLGLSATLEDEHKKFLAKHGIHQIFEVTLEEGLELGLVPEFNLYNLACVLTSEEEELYDYQNGLYKRKLAYFSAIAPYDDINLVNACMKSKGSTIIKIADKREKKTNLDWIKTVADFYGVTSKEVQINANVWRSAMMKRNQVLQKVQSKLDVTEYILNVLFKDKQSIAFVESIDEAKRLEKETNAVAYHSKLSSKKKDQILEDFDSVTLKQLITIKSLDEGFDSESLEGAIAKHFTSVHRGFIQRLGRLLRFDESNPDKHPVYISLYTVSGKNEGKMFQDKVQLMRAQKGIIGVNWIKHVNQIKL